MHELTTVEWKAVTKMRPGVGHESKTKSPSHASISMTQEEMEQRRRALEAKRAELLARQRNADEIVIEPLADATDESVRATERDLAVETLHRETLVLRLVTAALQRMKSGTYGTCLECEEPISSKRLAALPWAALCLQCQEAADRRRGRGADGSGPDSWLPDAA